MPVDTTDTIIKWESKRLSKKKIKLSLTASNSLPA